MGVATLFQVTLFRGDFSPADKIPSCQDSKDTLVQGDISPTCQESKWDMSPQGTLFLGDIPFKKSPRSRIFLTNIDRFGC